MSSSSVGQKESYHDKIGSLPVAAGTLATLEEATQQLQKCIQNGPSKTASDRAKKALAVTALVTAIAVVVLALVAVGLTIAGHEQFGDNTHYFKLIGKHIADHSEAHTVGMSSIGALICIGGLLYIFFPRKNDKEKSAIPPKELTAAQKSFQHYFGKLPEISVSSEQDLNILTSLECEITAPLMRGKAIDATGNPVDFILISYSYNNRVERVIFVQQDEKLMQFSGDNFWTAAASTRPIDLSAFDLQSAIQMLEASPAGYLSL